MPASLMSRVKPDGITKARVLDGMREIGLIGSYEQMSGHRTMSVFKRYNLVTEEGLSKVKWPSPDSGGENKSGVIRG
jgi:hypothetical protein